jgi:hypothetical protein
VKETVRETGEGKLPAGRKRKKTNKWSESKRIKSNSRERERETEESQTRVSSVTHNINII